MKFTQATILLCGAQLVAARAIIQTRSQWCQAIGQTTTSDSGGGPEQGPFTKTASAMWITREGNEVWESRENNLSTETLLVNISKSEWNGQDPIQWQSTFDPSSVSLTSCSMTDPIGHQFYPGYTRTWFDEGTVTVQYSNCTVNFLC